MLQNLHSLAFRVEFHSSILADAILNDPLLFHNFTLYISSLHVFEIFFSLHNLSSVDVMGWHLNINYSAIREIVANLLALLDHHVLLTHQIIS